MSTPLLDAPSGWGGVLVRSLTGAVAAFLVLQGKEWFDSGRLDTPGTAADAALIAGGVFVVNAILKIANGKLTAPR